MRKTLLFLLIACTACLVRAQQVDTTEKATFFEKAPMGLTRFYFDDYYYLVDKDCPFKTVERLSAFLPSKQAFQGDFRDFDRNGTVILRGHHDEGVKQGAFEAYHPNGSLKWEVTFDANKPVGDWRYYYPDGKPMLTVNYDGTRPRIMAFWDRKGRQRIKEGTGRYEFTMPFAFYNEYGYPFYERKGRVKGGIPRGYWTTHLVDDEGNKTLYTEETYDGQGVLTEGYDLFLDAPFRTPMGMIPPSYFYTAERLLSKTCSFDDHSGFYSYLAQKFEAMLTASQTIRSINDSFGYEVELSEEGNPTEVTLTDSLSTKELNPYLERALQEIPFYFPSIDREGNAIADTLSIDGKLSVDDAGIFHFHGFRITRKKQHP